MAEPLNTGLSAQQILTAFDRALNDYTDDEINAMLGEKQDTVADLEAIRTDAANGTSALQQVGIIGLQGAKNALHVIDFRSGTSHIPGPVTNRGVTYTINDDGTVTADGTSDPEDSSASSCQIWCEVARSGNYTFTCGENSATVSVDPDSLYDCFLGTQVGSAYTTLIRDFYSDEEQVKNTAYLEAGVPYRLNIRVHVGKTVDNEVFKPMLRLVDVTDETFTPYAPTNRELYEMIAALTARVEALENA